MSRKYQPKTKEYAEIMVVTSDEVYDDRGNINSNYELIGKVERELPNFVIRTNNRTKKSYYVEDTYNLTKKIKSELVKFFKNEKTEKGNERQKAYLVKEKDKPKGKNK